MSFLCHKTIDEPRVYRNPTPTKQGYEVTLETGVKVKYRREEVELFDNPTAALDWFYKALDERCDTLETRINHIRRAASAEIKRLQHEEFESL